MVTKREMGSKVREIRKKLDLTQEDLAKKIRPKPVRKETISRLERGTSNYGINLLFNIAEVLGCDISTFCSSNEKKPSSYLDKILEEYIKKTIEERSEKRPNIK